MNNKTTDMSVMRDGGALDYCRLNDITIQAWCSEIRFQKTCECYGKYLFP
ncbi:hypothetical protein [Butyrivibrio sp. INlla16]|nr:hypothetical protein [Butyrivibrio sp. INlla16]